MGKAAAETRVRLSERLLGIDFQKPRQIDDGEQQITQLVFNMGLIA